MKLVYAVLVIVLFQSCKNANPKFLSEMDKSLNKEEAEQIIQQLLDLPKWQWVYQGYDTTQLPIIIYNNGLIPENLDIKKFGKKVALLPLLQLPGMNYIEFKQFHYHNDTVDFIMEYPTEGAIARGYLIKADTAWRVAHYSVVEQ